jgi:uroporphyrinogen-III synthase
VDDAAELEGAAARLSQFDLAFFVSPNAVLHAMPALLENGPLPPGLVIATVGKGSERVLAGFGQENVIAPQSGFDSEAVLALPAFQPAAVSGKRVLILRGDGGRDLLGESLRGRGATVEYVTCYRRYCPNLDPELLLGLARKGQLDGISLTSSEGVGNLVAMVGEDGMRLLKTVIIFASHPRIAAHARAAGFERIVETAPGDAGLIDALESHF